MKERIVGAVILVAVVVLVVPVFLDGPPDSGEIISERVPLPGQADADMQTVVLPRDRDEPVPAAAGTRGAGPAQPEAAAPVRREAPPPVVPKAEPTAAAAGTADAEDTPAQQAPAAVEPAASSTGMWAVQLGSFSNKENAERLAADLRKQGYAAFLSQLRTASGQLHRVRIGPQKDREAAEQMAARLARAGHAGQVVPHP